MELSGSLRQSLHQNLGCFWSIKIHYILSRGRRNCTFVIIGMTVNFLSEQSEHCKQYPSTLVTNRTIRNWANERFDVTLVEASYTNTRVYCRNIEAIQDNLHKNCSNSYVNIICSRSKRIKRICSACLLKKPRCRQIATDEQQTPEFQQLNDMCTMDFYKLT